MPNNDEIWERGWVGHEREQLMRLARLPLPQKLQWLEEAHRLVRQLNSDGRLADLADLSQNTESEQKRP